MKTKNLGTLVLTICLLINIKENIYAQMDTTLKGTAKPAIQLSDLGTWPTLSNPLISNNGRFFCYVVNDNLHKSYELVIKKIDGSWRKSYAVEDPSFVVFAYDSKMFVFKRGDTLVFLTLGTNQEEKIAGVDNVKAPQSGTGQWIAYQLREDKNKLTLFDLGKRSKQSFAGVKDFEFENNSKYLLLTGDSSYSLQLFDLYTRKLSTIYFSVTDMVIYPQFNASGNQICFTTSNNKTNATAIWYYREGFGKAIQVATDSSEGIASGMRIYDAMGFSANGRWLFISIREKEEVLPTQDKSMVNIWTYKDLTINPQQRVDLSKGPRKYQAVINLSDYSILCYEKNDELTVITPQQITGDYTVIDEQSSNWEAPDWKWNPQTSYYLVSLKDNSRQLILKNRRSLLNWSFSPDGKYLVYYDNYEGCYYSLDVPSNKIINITRKVDANFVSQTPAVHKYAAGEVAGWYADGHAVVIYDNYDIWKLDAEGLVKPVNLTNGYGLKNKIKFRILQDEKSVYAGYILFDEKQYLLLTAFNLINKYNGFYKLNFKSNDPELLSMGPYSYYRTGEQQRGSYSNNMKPLKALKRNTWIVSRQSDVEAPNYFVTTDFKTFIPETDLQPQNRFNWLKAELVSWKMFNGEMGQGVLYKPENFNPEKKYPVIFHYYEKLSHNLYEFPYPAVSMDDIRISYFISNGYLVFLTDIVHKVAAKTDTSYGGWAYNAVVSAAEYLAKFSYVNGKKMGIQGHSFGGGQTNYIVTHSNIFAAAVEAAGTSDAVSGYLTLTPFVNPIEHYNGQWAIENGHSLTGATLWEKPNIYLKGSAVLHADKVTTPLLIMHNERDNQIPWRQGVELYMALRRLGKRVWMLQYDNGAHYVAGPDAVDYTIRMKQFFDHYLKDEPAPLWMVQGIPAKYKGIKTGYELDTLNRVP